MPINVDFTGVEGAGGDFEVLPAGLYPCTIFDIETKVGKDSGQPYLSWTLKVEDGHPNAGRRFWTNFSLQPQSLGFLKEALIRLGVPADQLVGQFSFEPRDLLGKRVLAKVGIQPASGQYSESNTVDRMDLNDGSHDFSAAPASGF